MNENEMYQFCYDNYQDALKFVEIFLDCFINAEHPTMDFFEDCVTCFDWYNVGREIVLSNYHVKDNQEYISEEELKHEIDLYTKSISQQILQGAIEYSTNNDINIIQKGEKYE